MTFIVTASRDEVNHIHWLAQNSVTVLLLLSATICSDNIKQRVTSFWGEYLLFFFFFAIR